MEGSNLTPYFFVKEIFLNIIIALRILFITFCYILNVFTLAIFFVCSFSCCCISSIFVSIFHLSHMIHFIIRL